MMISISAMVTLQRAISVSIPFGNNLLTQGRQPPQILRGLLQFVPDILPDGRVKSTSEKAHCWTAE